MSVHYSPLCDSDSVVYLAYLAAVVSNGSASVVDNYKRIAFGDGTVGGGSGNDDSRVHGDVGGVHVRGSSQALAVDVGGDFVGGGGCSCGHSGYQGESDARETVGVSRVSVDCGVSGVGVGDSHQSVGEVLGRPGVGFRGPNWARNQEWKARKKEKKKNRKNRVVVEQPVRQGFFSECDDDTRKQLRDSRAKLLIAKNKRELVEVNRRASQLDSPEMVVQDMLRLVKVSDSLKKRTKDTRIGGWAATLVDTVVERSASSVPNSVPSLTEVGLSDSVSQNGKIDRKNEYERKRAAIETEFENMEYYAGFEYDNAVADLKREYIDALCGESELAERKLINRVYQEYSKMYMECTKGIVSADAVLDMIADIKKEVEVEL